MASEVAGRIIMILGHHYMRRKRMKTIVHVNQHNIKYNAKNPEVPRLVLTAKTYLDNRYGQAVEILDKHGELVGTFIYSPNKPLSCGAKVWFETENQVNVRKTFDRKVDFTD